MDLAEIQAAVRAGRYFESRHGRNERTNENLTVQDVEAAVLSGRILEQYADTGRGESCLVVGFSGANAVHIVCGWSGPKKDEAVIVTVYKPSLPKFSDPWTRAKQ